ncbi:MAG: M4 family metallopeptidase, partial [Flavobacteriales bacterium]
MTGDSLENLKYYTDTIYPSGIIRFDLSKSQEFSGIESLYPLLEVQEGSTFQLVKKTASRFDTDKVYQKYQQYYQGIKVEGGGYTVVSFMLAPGDPCEEEYMLSPFIHSNIDVTTTPDVQSTALDTILTNENGIQSELVITLNLLDACQYHLAWKALYSYNGSKISWVDAHSGSILKTVDADVNLNAPTITYGVQNLDDSTVGNTTTLESADDRVRTFNFTTCPNGSPVDPAQWTTNLIPSTNASEWTTEAEPAVYQAHFVVTSILPAFDGIDVNFGEVNVASCVSIYAQAYIFSSTMSKAYIFLGRAADGSTTLALFDVAGHEMSHIFLTDFLDYTQGIHPKSLHEGISDMIGTYAESIVQGNVDWVMKDDDLNLWPPSGRDLQNPVHSCFNDVKNSSEEHERSEPLGHWFYLISEGDASTGLPALGIESALQIVLESLYFVPQDGDYPELRDATLMIVDDEFGPCSDEGTAVRMAWNQICVGAATCGFSIVGPNEVCEEDDYLHLFVSGGLPGATYRWYFPLGWTVEGNPPGNYIEGPSLTVTDFPKYNWYPRYFQITVVMLGTGEERTKTIKLVDCLNDDPTCQGYNAIR